MIPPFGEDRPVRAGPRYSAAVFDARDLPAPVRLRGRRALLAVM
jgi:hypothetical protein